MSATELLKDARKRLASPTDQKAVLECARGSALPHVAEKSRVVVDTRLDLWMSGSKFRREGIERAAVQRLGFGVLTAAGQQQREIVFGHRHIGMIWTE